MAENRRYGVTPQLDIRQILLEAQKRWLRPAEICEILENHTKFYINPEPPHKPPSGSLFLFDRKILRYFRKDGHNWRKKKDGKTVKEAHERLKAGSVDVLHCYYAHGEDCSNFQRRCYWLLDEKQMNIVLVHYLEVKGKETYTRSKDNEEMTRVSHNASPSTSNSAENYNHRVSQDTNNESLSSVRTSEYEDSEPDFQASSRYNPFAELPRFNTKTMTDSNLLNPYIQGTIPGQKIESDRFFVDQEDITKIFDETGSGYTFNGSRMQSDLTSWGDVLEHCKEGIQDELFPPAFGLNSIPSGIQTPDGDGTVSTQGESEWKFSDQEPGFSALSNLDVKKTPVQEVAKYHSLLKQLSLDMPNGEESGFPIVSNLDAKKTPVKEVSQYHSLLKQLSLDMPNREGEKDLQKHDSFSQWMSREEFGEVGGSHIQSSYGMYWDAVLGGSNDSTMSHQDNSDTYLLSPSLSQDQYFSIKDFSPNWAYSESGSTKILITGTFLLDKIDIAKYNWSCMFSEVEVPAMVLADGLLQCYAPSRKPGRIPFYVTCSNRLACSEVREFEYRDKHAQYLDTFSSGSSPEITLYLRLERILSEVSFSCLEPLTGALNGKAHTCHKISALLETDGGFPLVSKKGYEKGVLIEKTAQHPLQQTMLKEKLHAWLLHKVAEDGKGPNILDKEGQNVIHLASALGYDWVIAPTLVAGVNINFRDIHGWTALHWAASFGRETTVITLLSLGAAPGAVTDPTTDFPSGRTPADFAANNGHKGIAGFLAESSLTSHLSSLNLNQSLENNVSDIYDIKATEDAKKNLIKGSDEDPLKNSLDAVRSSVQAAARIHQVFRIQSFHRKEQVKCGDDKFGMSNEQALSLVSVKTNKVGNHDEPVQTAAVRIQNKFRGWKGRKEFVILRQRIVKIQALVRGRQVRKHYKKIVWSVGIVEKVILRWRRKGSGLRGFRSEALIEGPAMQVVQAKEDDYDFLQDGVKQTEARLERALARVKSMVQYPEARDQYKRLLTGVEEFQESKVMLERILNDSEENIDTDMLFDLDELLEDDIPMHAATTSSYYS